MRPPEQGGVGQLCGNPPRGLLGGGFQSEAQGRTEHLLTSAPSRSALHTFPVICQKVTSVSMWKQKFKCGLER